MRQVSDRWADAVARSHRLSVAAVLLDGTGETLLDTTIDGTVTRDSGAASAARMDLTLGDDGTGLVPTLPSSPLAPYGNEIRLERGLRYEDDVIERVSLGVFRIDEVEADETGEIRLNGLDRSARVIDAKFEEDYQVPAGENYGEAILAVVQDVYPDVEYDFAETALETPALFAEVGDDRWEFAQGMATAIGAELYFDGDGVLILRPTPAATVGNPVAELVEGERGVLVKASRRWTREKARNRWIATGENTGGGDPVRGVWTDDDSASPTRYGGPFGVVPDFYSHPGIVTDDQAADVATAIGVKGLGTTQQVSFGSVVNPALEPFDVVRITRQKLGIDEDHVIDTLTIPLGREGELTGQTRAVQVA